MNIVAVDNLVKRYNEVLALDHFSLHIESGEVFGLLGPNGSGKTTAINCILQLLTYDKGTIELFGQTMRPSSYDLKRRIGIVPQNVAVFEELTVRENIDYFCALYVNDRAKRRDLVDEAIAFVGETLGPFYLQDPTVAVDPQSRNAILEGIQNMNRQGSTVVYTSHYMEEVEEICTRIMIMDHGQALATGTNAELKAMIGTGEKIQIDVPELDEATLARLDALPHVTRTLYREGTLELACQNGTHNVSDVLAVLQRDGAQFGRIYAEPPTLNDVFLEITGTELRD